jgi:lysophospholipase L1-like esterase
MIRILISRLMLAVLLMAPVSARGNAPRIALLGDSITYGATWAIRVESALRSGPIHADAEIVNFGLPSETVSGLSEDGHAGGKFPRPCLHERLERVLEAFQPTHVIACYGMNDGIYLPPSPERLQAFRKGIETLRTAVMAAGAELVLITPPLHDADKAATDPERYDAVLDQFAQWLVEQRAAGWQVIDIRPPLRQAIAQAKAETPSFTFAGDGVHPGPDGHRFIADAVLARLWVEWSLPGAPVIAGAPALAVLETRHQLLKHAWLTETKHLRPGIPAGPPLAEARARAVELLADYRAAVAAQPASASD